MDHFTILVLLPAPVAAYSDFTALYVAKYDVPPADSKVFIRTVKQINGWRDLPRPAFAIVPASVG